MPAPPVAPVAPPTTAARPAPKTARGIRTRETLLKAARSCFAERGYHAVAVGDITQVAGMAIGTFYLYFNDKLDVFRAVVDLLQTELRTFLRRPAGDNRLERERQGVSDFLTFAREHPEIFRILQESYVVDPEIYFSYFEGIAARYAQRLQEAQDKDEVARGDADIQAWCLIAVSNFLGMRYARPGRKDAELARVIETATEFVTRGLAPRHDGRDNRDSGDKTAPPPARKTRPRSRPPARD